MVSVGRNLSIYPVPLSFKTKRICRAGKDLCKPSSTQWAWCSCCRSHTQVAEQCQCQCAQICDGCLKHNRNTERIRNVKVATLNLSSHQDSVSTEKQQRSAVIQDAPKTCVSKLNMDLDVVESIEDVILASFDKTLSEKQKDLIRNEYLGSEIALLNKMPQGPKSNALISPLQVEEHIGYMEQLNRLAVGRVTKAHPNGQYDISLLNGQNVLFVWTRWD